MIKNAAKTVEPTQLPITKKTQELLLTHIKSMREFFDATLGIKRRMEAIDMSYQREGNLGEENWKAKIANRYGDKSKVQDMTIPIVQSQVDSMQSYLSSVFLSGTPIFGVVGDKSTEDAALMYEAIIDENSKHGGWVRELGMFFKDGLKYNLAATEVDWKIETIYRLDDTSVTQEGSAPKQRNVLWEGNTIKRLDLYNSIWDTRCLPSKLHEQGEFFGWTEPMSATRLKQFIQDLNGRLAANVLPALNQAKDLGHVGFSAGGYYSPKINPDSFISANSLETNWFVRLGLVGGDANSLPSINLVSTYYIRIIPANFLMLVPQRNNSQIWKIIVVNSTHIIYAERETNMHNWLPVVMAQLLEDGLGYQTKSYAQNAEVFQEVSTAIWNASLAAQRRSVYDRIFYDPSRINKADINSPNPVARIPVKSNAYGKPISEAYSHASFTNDQFSNVVQQLGLINNMANIAQGSNPAQQGQFVKGNKTQHEYSDVMGHSNNRQQTIALFLEAQYFYVVKQILKLNIMQFASTGSIFSTETRTSVAIDPLKLRQDALAFEVSDGLLPTDRLISSDTFQIMLQTIPTNPQLQMEFDFVGMMIYYFKTQGAKNIDQFRLTSEQKQAKLAQMQQVTAANTPTSPTQQTSQQPT